MHGHCDGPQYTFAILPRFHLCSKDLILSGLHLHLSNFQEQYGQISPINWAPLARDAFTWNYWRFNKIILDFQYLDMTVVFIYIQYNIVVQILEFVLLSFGFPLIATLEFVAGTRRDQIILVEVVIEGSYLHCSRGSFGWYTGHGQQNFLHLVGVTARTFFHLYTVFQESTQTSTGTETGWSIHGSSCIARGTIHVDYGIQNWSVDWCAPFVGFLHTPTAALTLGLTPHLEKFIVQPKIVSQKPKWNFRLKKRA